MSASEGDKAWWDSDKEMLICLWAQRSRSRRDFIRGAERINSVTGFCFTVSPELNSNCRRGAGVINRRAFRAGRPGDCLPPPHFAGGFPLSPWAAAAWG